MDVSHFVIVTMAQKMSTCRASRVLASWVNGYICNEEIFTLECAYILCHAHDIYLLDIFLGMIKKNVLGELKLLSFFF